MKHGFMSKMKTVSIKQKGEIQLKKQFSKIICFSLAVALMATMAAGCGKKGSSNADNETSSKSEQAVEIKIPVYERGIQGEPAANDNFWTRWIQQKALEDINVKVTYVPIPRQQDVDKFNMLLAAKEAPDIIFSYDYPVISAFYTRGALQEIPKDVLDKNGPNLKKYLGEETLKYGEIDGKQYLIPARRPQSYSYMTLIRQDWLEKLNLPMPTNLDEYYNVLKAFKEKDPSGLGSNNIIPLTFSLKNATDAVANYGFRSDDISEEEHAMYSDVLLPSLSWEPTKEMLRFNNKLYNEGLISQEFALDKDGKKAEADFMNGKAGIYGGDIAKSPPIIQTLMQNVPTAKLKVLPPQPAPGTTAKGREYWPFGMLSGINKECKHVDAVIKFIDWMSREDILFTLQKGIEGKNYTLKDGEVVLNNDFTGEEKLLNGTNKDLWCLVTESEDLGDEMKNLEAEAKLRAPEGFEYLFTENYEQTKKIKGIQDFLFDRPVESVNKYRKTLLSKYEEAAVKLIMCKPSEFDALYETFKTEYLNSGYQEILDEKKQIYNEMKKK